jgi:hypothetical protein
MDGLFDHDLCFLWFFVYLGDTVTGLTMGSLGCQMYGVIPDFYF